jgi:hypothetical protein
LHFGAGRLFCWYGNFHAHSAAIVMSFAAVSQPKFLYVVRCTFAPNASAVAPRWLAWLREQHLSEVLAAGAISAEIIRVDNSGEAYEIHYRFASRDAFDRYEREHAPRLRADGLARFPLNLGLKYERRTGEVLESRA